MPITHFQSDYVGQEGVLPRAGRIASTDNFASVTAEGYIDSIRHQGYNAQDGDFVFMSYNSGASNGIFNVQIGNGNISTLLPYVGEGSVELPVVSGHFANFDGATGLIQDAGFLPSDATKTRVVMASASVNISHIACFSDINGTVNDDSSTAINAGNIQAGISGTAGLFQSFPPTAAKGSFIFQASDNAGNTNTAITNSSMGQATVITIPDPNTSSTSFMLTNSGSTQVIESGDVQISNGDLFVGSSGSEGTLNAYPSTASSGFLTIEASDNSADFQSTITNHEQAQASVWSIPDVGTTADFMMSTVPVDPIGNANFYVVNTTISFSGLSTGGSVTVIPSTDSNQYQVIGISLNAGGTNFSGIGGDRDGVLTDGTSNYTTIPAATMQALVNAVWGSTDVPVSGFNANNEPTLAGAPLVFQYSGGTTDYTAGSLVLTVMYIRIA